MSGKKKFVWVALGLLIALGAAGYFYYTTTYLQAQAPQTATLQTSTVRQGDLVVSVSGSGSIVAASEVNLAFQSSGTVTAVNVQVGDQVKAGDVLAEVDKTDAQASVDAAQLQVDQAELALDPATLARDKALAQISVDQAKITLATAQAALNDLLTWTPDSSSLVSAQADLATAQITVQQAQSAYDRVAWRNDVAASSEAATLQQATIALETAKAKLAAVQEGGPSATDISDARAQVSAAQLSLQQAQLNLDAAGDQSQAENSLAQAKLTLEAAQRSLAQTTLVAPVGGTVTSIDVQVGESAGSGTVITLADLSQPLLDVYLDESDLAQIKVGYEADVTFDALPDQVFTGTVTKVDPSLVTVENVPTVKAQVTLQASPERATQTFPVGMNATVDVISGKATGALLVPVQALRELSAGQYAVFVVKDGEPTLQVVEVGLQDLTSAEIKSGLQLGDVVSTGLMETSK